MGSSKMNWVDLGFVSNEINPCEIELIVSSWLI